MEAEGTPSILLEVLQDVEPVSEVLTDTWRRLGSATLEAEEGRLRERFLVLASRLITISEVRGEK